jgi:hypothetical protein
MSDADAFPSAPEECWERKEWFLEQRLKGLSYERVLEYFGDSIFYKEGCNYRHYEIQTRKHRAGGVDGQPRTSADSTADEVKGSAFIVVQTNIDSKPVSE